MHELSIALSILDLAEEEAAHQGGLQVRAIHLKLGPLAGVIKEALLSAYELAREQSPLADAQLIIKETELLAYCSVCQANRAAVSIQQLTCAQCGAVITDIVSGRELEVVALEIQ